MPGTPEKAAASSSSSPKPPGGKGDASEPAATPVAKASYEQKHNRLVRIVQMLLAAGADPLAQVKPAKPQGLADRMFAGLRAAQQAVTGRTAATAFDLLELVEPKDHL